MLDAERGVFFNTQMEVKCMFYYRYGPSGEIYLYLNDRFVAACDNWREVEQEENEVLTNII